MKMIKNILGALLLSTIVLGLSSCLKESPENIDPSKGTANVVEFANTGDDVSNTAASTYPRFNADLGSVAPGASVEFNVNVSYSGIDYAPQDINVTLAVDQEALTLFNSQNSTSYEVPPADVFTMPTTAVIKKGEKKAQIKVTITNSANFDFNKSYALPLKIASASAGTVSGNFGKAIYSFSARNQYDGIYSVESGTVTRYTAPGSPAGDALSGDVAGNPDLSLATDGANTVEISNLQWANAGGGVAGIANLRVTVDPATNAVTVNSLGNPTLANWEGKENTYDPTTKTFHLAFRWNPTANVREYETVIKYKGPR